MKKIISILILLTVALFAANAQVASSNSDFSFKGGKFYQNGVAIDPGQLPSILGQETYNKDFKQGKGMRVAGISMLSVGGAVTALGAGMFVSGLANDSNSVGQAVGDTASGAFGVLIAIPGIVVAATGGILLGVGNKKLKNIRPASYGAGVAFAF